MMQPKVKKTKDQKWKGTNIQFRGSSKTLAAIDVFAQGAAHDFNGRCFAGPYLERFGSLVKKHSQAIGCAAACLAGGSQQRGFGRAIDHVIHRIGRSEGKLCFVERGLVVWLQPQGGRIDDEIDGTFWVTDRSGAFRKSFGDFRSDYDGWG